MAFKDYLLKEIDNLRDRRNQAFNIFFALISGSVAMIVYVDICIILILFVISIFLNKKIIEDIKSLENL